MNFCNSFIGSLEWRKNLLDLLDFVPFRFIFRSVNYFVQYYRHTIFWKSFFVHYSIFEDYIDIESDKQIAIFNWVLIKTENCLDGIVGNVYWAENEPR